MLLSEVYKIVVNKVTFVGFRGSDRPNRPLDPPLLPLKSNLPASLPVDHAHGRSPR